MARESRFGLFLAAVMVLSLAVAASADPKLHSARSAERAMERTRSQLSHTDAPSLRVVKRADREAREEQPLPDGIYSSPPIGTQIGAPIGTSTDPTSGTACRHCDPTR